MSNYDDKIGIIGLGKLGLPMLAAFVKRGFNPIGYDVNGSLIRTLIDRINPYKEPGIQDIINNDSNWSKRFYTNLQDFLNKIDTAFIIVPTPTKNKIFDRTFLEKALNEISKKINKNLNVVITSTVNPGDCDDFQKILNKKNKNKIKIIYSPEFIALGSVLDNMLNPDSVLLGGNDDQAINTIFSIYQRLYCSFPEFHRLSYVEAETAKIGINTFITTKISYANSIGMFVENLTNSRVSAQKVLDAIGSDSRIGRKYFKYGLSYGGPCFPRDNRALSTHFNKYSVPDFIPKATDNVNNKLIEFWKNKIQFKKYDAIVFIGVAYKSGTDFLEESFILKLAKKLKIKQFYYDVNVNSLNNSKLLDETNNYELLKNFKNIMVLVNYGSFSFDSRLNNLDIVDVWI